MPTSRYANFRTIFDPKTRKRRLETFPPITSEQVRSSSDVIIKLDQAERIVGKTLYVSTGCDESINMISKDLLGYSVVTDSGEKIGELKDVMWLPSNDAYVIHDGKKEYLIPLFPR